MTMIAEKDYWPQVMAAWERRAKLLGLKPKTRKYIDAQEAFLQGVLATATATGVMTMDRANQMAFFVMVGRIDEVMKWHTTTPDTATT